MLSRFEHHQSLGHFSPPAIRYADHRCFEHCRMFVEHGLHFHRRNVLTAAHNDVLGAIHHLNVAIRVHDRQVTTVEPTASHGLGGFLWLLIIALHHVVAAFYDPPHTRLYPLSLLDALGDLRVGGRERP